MTRACILHGFINPTGLTPAFVIPVFSDTTRDNHIYVQKIAVGDFVERFERLDTGDHAVTIYDEKVSVAPGDTALWGFQFDTLNCLIAHREALRPRLEVLQTDLPPMLRLQVARVLDDPDLIDRIEAAHTSLRSMSAAAADLWRDLVILLPEIRQALRLALSRPGATLSSAITDIDLRTTGDRLCIRASQFLTDNFGGAANLTQVLKPLERLFASLGISTVSVESPEAAMREEVNSAREGAHGLTIVTVGSTVLSGALSARSSGVNHLPIDQVLDARGKVMRSGISLIDEAVLIVVEDRPDCLKAATTLSGSLASKRPYLGAIVVRSGRLSEEFSRYPEAQDLEERFYSLSRTSRWLALIGGAYSGGGPHGAARSETFRPLDNNAPSHIVKWVVEALAACLRAGVAGKDALVALHQRARGTKFAAVASAVAAGADAPRVAAEAALDSTVFSACPAADARELLLVVFHNRPQQDESSTQVALAARKSNETATIWVVEAARRGIKDRARVVVIARGRRPAGLARIPRDHLLRLFRFGWSVDQSIVDDVVFEHSIRKGSTRFVVRVEAELILDQDEAEQVVGSTPMHHGEVALLVKEMPEPAVRERLLTSAIFCVTSAKPEALEDYGDPPFPAMLVALGKLNRAIVCDRVSRFIAGYVLTGLWDLSSRGPGTAVEVYHLWFEGVYQREAKLNHLRLHRIASDGTLYFDGIIRLDPQQQGSAPSLISRFGVALGRHGLRATRPLIAIEKSISTT